MRKWAAAIIVTVLLVPAVVAGASDGGASEEAYKDYFDTVSYSGNNGSLDWSGPWVEGGENNGPGSGAIRVTEGDCAAGKCLELRGGLLGQPSIRRASDLSEFLDARLHYRAHLDPVLLSTGVLHIEVKGAGSGWTVVADYPLLTQPGTHSDSVDVSTYAGSDFEVRFRLGQLLGGDRVFIDDVEVIGSVPVPTTTTSTTTSTTSTTSTTTPTATSTSTPAGTSPSTTTPATGTATSSPAAPSASPTTTVANAAGPAEMGTSTTVEPGPTAIEDEQDDDSPAVTGITTPTGSVPGDAPTGSGAVPTALAVPDGSGLRLSRVGVLADYRAGIMGDMGTGEIEVLGVSLEADFSMAVEAFQATRLWIAALALVIAAALVSGMDIRRSRKGVAGLMVPDPDRGASEIEE
jgi:cell division septation protein DedD